MKVDTTVLGESFLFWLKKVWESGIWARNVGKEELDGPFMLNKGQTPKFVPEGR